MVSRLHFSINNRSTSGLLQSKRQSGQIIGCPVVERVVIEIEGETDKLVFFRILFLDRSSIDRAIHHEVSVDCM